MDMKYTGIWFRRKDSPLDDACLIKKGTSNRSPYTIYIQSIDLDSPYLETIERCESCIKDNFEKGTWIKINKYIYGFRIKSTQSNRKL